MRLRLAHTQALLLLSAVLLTVLCMGALNAWNLRNGFSDFLASRDVERLESFAALVSTRAEAAGGLDALAAQGVDLRMLLREFGQTQGAVPRPPLLPANHTVLNSMARALKTLISGCATRIIRKSMMLRCSTISRQKTRILKARWRP